MKEQWPALAATIAKLDEAHSVQTRKPPHISRWTQRIVQGLPKRQKELVTPVMEQAKKTMLGLLAPPARNRVLGGASREARAWLHCPEGETPMPDVHFQVAARMRYNDPNPWTACNMPGGLRTNLARAVPGPPHPTTAETCQNSDRRLGRVCGVWCKGDGGGHAINCKIGGGVQQRHDNSKNIFGSWLLENGVPPQLEQAVPAWDTLRIIIASPRAQEQYQLSFC